ncbi:MAG: hypothetical protein RL632_1901 [Bacteroidota bacterium]|jgi:hypothetical protein
MKKRIIVSTGATPKTLRLSFEKVIVGENPKNKTGKAYALSPKKAEFASELHHIVRSFQELPGNLIVFVQNQTGLKFPIAVISSASDLREAVRSNKVSDPEWCLRKLEDYHCSTLVFQPAKAG